jgi:hypothetical protein
MAQLPSLYELLTGIPSVDNPAIKQSANKATQELKQQIEKPYQEWKNKSTIDKLKYIASHPIKTINAELQYIQNKADELGDITHLNNLMSSVNKGISSVPLVGGTVAAFLPKSVGELLPSTVEEAALFAIPMAGEGGFFLKNLLKNATRFGVANVGIQGISDITQGKTPTLKELGTAGAIGATMGIGGTVIPKGLVKGSEAIKEVTPKIAKSFAEAVKETMPSLYIAGQKTGAFVDRHVITKITNHLSPEATFRIKGLNAPFYNNESAKSIASVASAIIVNKVEQTKDALAMFAKIAYDGELPYVNEYTGAYLAQALDDKSFGQTLGKMIANPQTREVAKQVLEFRKFIHDLRKETPAAEPYLKNQKGVILKKANEKNIKFVPYERYITHASHRDFSLMPKTLDVLKSAKSVTDKTTYARMQYNSILFPIEHYNINQIGQKFRNVKINPLDAKILTEHILDETKGFLKGDYQKLKEQIYSTISQLPLSTTRFGNIYKPLKKMFMEMIEDKNSKDPYRLALKYTNELYGEISAKQQITGAEFDKILDATVNKLIKNIEGFKNIPKEELEKIEEKYVEEFLSKFGDTTLSYKFLKKSFITPSPYKKVNEYFNPTPEGGLLKGLTNLKRFWLSFSPIHFRSLTFSNSYYTGDFNRSFEVLVKSFSSDKDFYNYILPQFRDVVNLLKEVPSAGFMLSGTADIKRSLDSIIKDKAGSTILQKIADKTVGKLDKALWDRMYNSYKINYLSDIYKKLKAGEITKETAAKLIHDGNVFFGGLPQFAIISPGLRNALRLLLLAPDWELGLLKQIGNALTGRNEQAVRYYYNILAFNAMTNSAISAFRGQQPSTTTPEFFKYVANGDIDKLFRQVYVVNGMPMNVSILGFEEEMPKMIADAVKVPLSLLGEHSDFLTALSTLVRDVLNKSSVGVQILNNLYGFATNPQQNASNLTKLILPFVFRPSYTGDISSSIISSFGFRAHELPKAKAAALLFTKDVNVNPKTIEKINEYITKYYTELQKARGTTINNIQRSYNYNLFSGILNNINPEAIPHFSTYYNKYELARQKGDTQTMSDIATALNDNAQKFYETVYKTISNSTAGKKLSENELQQLAVDIVNYALLRARQQASRTLVINPDNTNTTQNTTIQDTTNQEIPTPDQLYQQINQD